MSGVLTAQAQWQENFSDGNFTSNPAWMGDTAEWAVNDTFALQSNCQRSNHFFQLRTASTPALSVRWEITVRLGFNTSSVNYVDIYLISADMDLGSASNTAYFVRLGGSTDEISLYRKSPDSPAVRIIDGADGILNSTSSTIRLRVVRDDSGSFTLYREMGLAGSGFVREGTVTDIRHATSACFGILVRQSTAAFFGKHFFSDIRVSPFLPDTVAPRILSATAPAPMRLELLFNEPLDMATATLPAHYMASHGLGMPDSAWMDARDPARVHLQFAVPIPNGIPCRLSVNGVGDSYGNRINNAQVDFFHYRPSRYDVVIDEIMADPSPPLQLPEKEWIELRNRARFPVNLRGWRLGDRSSLSGPMPVYWLPPDSLVIVCASASAAALEPFGPVLVVSAFPSLDNEGDLLYLQTDEGLTMHALEYDLSWYRNPVRQSGGSTLEMRDVQLPCEGPSNWQASTDIRGGTPGRRNSCDTSQTVFASPRPVHAYATDPMHVVLVMDGPIDSLSASSVSRYHISRGIDTPQSVTVLRPLFNRILLRLNQPLLPLQNYSLSISDLRDCNGNPIETLLSVRLALGGPPDSLNLVVNEVLFNPPPEGSDFVELYNRGPYPADLSQLYLANRNAAGMVGSSTPLAAEPLVLFPGEHLALTEDLPWIRSRYRPPDSARLLTLPVLPSYNDDAGTVVLLNTSGSVLDEVPYHENWHFPLIRDREGISLERTGFSGSSSESGNWHSASSSTGHATPGYRNSQYRSDEISGAVVEVTPKAITPDNDGQDDYLRIGYRFPESGFVATVTVFDAWGRPVRLLQRNALCGTAGYFVWNGLGEDGRDLAAGMYVVLTEVFHPAGKKRQFRNVVVVARQIR